MNEKIWYGGRPGVPERQKVLAAIDLALWDIKAKWLGVPVYELLGGKFRDRIPLYWSHFATYRAVWPEVVGQPPTHTYAEWAAGARDVVAQGYKVLKTNLIAEGGPDGKARLPRYLDGAIDNADDRRRGDLDRDAPGRRRAGHRHRRGRPVRLPDGRHRQARPGARAVRPVLAGGREPRPGRAAGGTRADVDPPVPRREPHPARAVPAVLPEARHGRRDDRDAVQRPVRVAQDRRDGRAVRHDDLAPQLDEPARDADQRAAVRRASRTSRSSRSTSTTSPGRATC